MFETMSFTNMIHFLKRPTLPQYRACHFSEHLTNLEPSLETLKMHAATAMVWTRIYPIARRTGSVNDGQSPANRSLLEGFCRQSIYQRLRTRLIDATLIGD
jgi:hypothetical protein